MNNKEQALNTFLDGDLGDAPQNTNKKEIVMKEREGLIERADPIFVTQEGKQLLREQY